MIRSFRCRETERVFFGQPTRAFPPDILRTAQRKLQYLDGARTVNDLRVPPGNRLEALRGNRAGQWSIRINDQWPGALWAMLHMGGDRPGRRGDCRLPLKGHAMEQAVTSSAIHPGEVLREDFLSPLGITAYRLAKALGMTESAVSEILHGKRGITAATALRLSRFFGTSAELWLNLQAAYELDEERTRLGDRLEAITPADLDELHRQRMKSLEERRSPLHAQLGPERARLAEDLDAIQHYEQ